MARRTVTTTRRRIVQGLGALATLPRAVRAAPVITDVVVAGAGLAGLNAALILEEQGYKVVVLEAGPGPGGRVQTRDIGGRLQELGASDIGTGYGRVLDQVQRRGLKTVPWNIRVRPFTYHVNGRLVAGKDWAGSPANRLEGDERALLPAMLEMHYLGRNPLKEPDDWLQPEFRSLDIAADDWFAAQGASAEARRLIGASFQLSDSTGTSALSVLRDGAILKASGANWQGKPPPMQQVEGGNQRLPQAMAATLKTPLRTGTAVQGVRAAGTSLEVSASDGQTYRARRVILAVPLTALRRIRFEPALPPDQARAFREMGYSRTSKFYLRATKPFWEADSLDASLWTDTELERIFALEDADGSVSNLLVWLNRTAPPFDRLTGADARAYVLKRLAELRPATAGKVEVIAEHSWLTTAGIEGCLARYGPGQVTAFADVLPRRHGAVHFAGEHTRRVDVGMEAAMASGERAALEVIAAG
jgi:monoamine oxidase